VDLKRIFRHLLMTRWRVKRAFSARVLSAIESAIRESHRAHAGQVRFVVEGALDSSGLFDGLTARERAIDVFSQLRVWDTECNNGILIYLLLADRDVEIVADRGIDARVSGEEWEAVCRMMEADFRRGKYQPGVIRGIEQVSALLKTHFPTRTPPREDLPSFPVVM
jgi:uncharacterized membrane protein YgcG